jgi:hypothetical protein
VVWSVGGLQRYPSDKGKKLLKPDKIVNQGELLNAIILQKVTSFNR